MSTVGISATRVNDQTAPEVNQRIERQGAINVHYYANRPELIDERLRQLDSEWDIERWLQMNSSALTLLGLTLSVTRHRGWLILPLAIQGMFMQHAVKGWCPPLPLLRSFGVRTEAEIQAERYALKAIRGDFEAGNDPRRVTQAVQQ